MEYFDIHTHKRPVKPVRTVFSLQMDTPSVEGGFVRYSAGIHPWFLTEENASAQWDWLLEEVSRPDIVAIGECGLDRIKGPSLEIQTDVFRKCIALSERLSLPLIVHAVKCTQQLIRIKKEMNPAMPWIIHGFRGKKEVAEEYIRHGFYLSFGEHFQEAALRSTPLERILIETDESSLSIEDIYWKVADSYGISMELLAESIASNVKKFCFFDKVS